VERSPCNDAVARHWRGVTSRESWSAFLNVLLFVGVFFLIAWFGCRDDRRNVRRGRGEIETRRVA
jgi:hypothetical protein